MEFISPRFMVVVAFGLFVASCVSKDGDERNVKHEVLPSVETKKQTNMKGYLGNIEVITLQNKNFREVLYTSKQMQLVVMSLKPGEDIGEEVHPNVDQFFRVENGMGQCVVNDVIRPIIIGDAIIIPAGAKHNIINTDDKLDLKLYTIYSPPNHQDQIVRKSKLDAENTPEEFDGKTTE